MKNYLPLTGGTLTGNINIKKDTPILLFRYGSNNSGFAATQANNVSILRNTNDANDNSNKREIRLFNSNYLSSIQRALQLYDTIDGTDFSYAIFGEHNKPTGSYSGNGSATNRTVEIGGIGSILLVVGSNGYLSFVTVSGSFGITGSGTSMTVLKKSECAFSVGVLTMASASNFLNASGITYYYRLL